MTLSGQRRLAWGLFGVAAVLEVAGLVLLTLSVSQPAVPFGFRGANIVLAAPFSVMGLLLARGRPLHPLGWLFLAASIPGALQAFGEEYAVFALLERDPPLPGGVIAAWSDTWLWVFAVGLIAIYGFLIFPTGRLRSPRWRPVLLTGAVGMALFAGLVAVYPSELQGVPLQNPFGLEGAKDVLDPLFGLGALVFIGSIAAAVASLVLRFRDARGEERLQLRWFAVAAALVVLSLSVTPFAVDVTWLAALTVFSLALVPVATGIAVLKYRLYEIDIVLSRAVMFGALAAFITAVYMTVVVGIGAAVGTRGEPNVFLAILATAIVAVAFQPIRERARHLANRLVYGKRATPYEVLSELSGRLAGSYGVDDVLPRMAAIIGEGTGASRAEVWVRVGSVLQRAAVWPGGDGSDRLSVRGDSLPDFPSGVRPFGVRHRRELLGAVAVAMPPGEPLDPARERLMEDLASQAGLVLQNVRLIAELRASRQRLVAAQDWERRRLERNLHDGAQQHLVSLMVKLRLAEQAAGGDPEGARSLLADLQGEAADALEALRDLARGIYPPLLADQGLTAALVSHARKVPVPVDVAADGIARYPAEIEAAVYFCCLEALQNAAKYADASRIQVRLSEEDGEVRFAVEDDGVGFDPEGVTPGVGLQNMRDRLEALGGRLELRARPGVGTTVTGRIPVEATEPVA